MPTLRLAVQVDSTGSDVPPLPYLRVFTFAEAITLDYDLVTGTAFVDPPGVSAFPTAIQAIFLATNRDITIRTSGQTDAGLLLRAGGIFIAFDTSATGVKIQNNSGSTAHILGALLGA